MNRPVSLQCGHSACKCCVERMIEMQHTSPQNKCFVCKKIFKPDQIQVNFVVNALISKMKITCTNDDCSWEGRHEQKEEHCDNCQLCLVVCQNGCFTRHIIRRNLEEHLNLCQYQKVPCRHCTRGIRRCSLAEHEGSCTETPSQCPLACGDSFPR